MPTFPTPDPIDVSVEISYGRLTVAASDTECTVSAAEARVRMAQDRIQASEQALYAATAAHETATLNLERVRALFGEGLQSKRALELAELEVVRSRTDADRANSVLSAARVEESALAASPHASAARGSDSLAARESD